MNFKDIRFFIAPLNDLYYFNLYFNWSILKIHHFDDAGNPKAEFTFVIWNIITHSW